MNEVKTFQLAHLPPGHAVHVSLFKDVKNASFLRQQLLSGNTDFEYAFIDATTVLSTTHVLAAVFRAVNDMLANRLKSRNVHSETVFSLSINNNISESFRRFGIADTTRSLLCIKIATPSTPSVSAASVQAHLRAHVEGTQIEFADSVLGELTDVERIKKIYRIGDGGGGAGGKGGKKGRSGRGGGGGGGSEERYGDGVGGAGSGEGQERQRDERREMEIAILGMMALKGS